MPDDHSEVVPLLPIPNRTVKRLCADDSADSRVKVGHRQALTAGKARSEMIGLFLFAPPKSLAEVGQLHLGQVAATNAARQFSAVACDDLRRR